jgi:hypothetical protein
MEFIRPVGMRKRFPDEDYRVIREVLKALSSDGKFFAYCIDDDTLIWHEGRGPWQRDDDGARFIALAASKSSYAHAKLTLDYFKKSCFTSHIDATTKAKRLRSAQSRGGVDA